MGKAEGTDACFEHADKRFLRFSREGAWNSVAHLDEIGRKPDMPVGQTGQMEGDVEKEPFDRKFRAFHEFFDDRGAASRKPESRRKSGRQGRFGVYFSAAPCAHVVHRLYNDGIADFRLLHQRRANCGVGIADHDVSRGRNACFRKTGAHPRFVRGVEGGFQGVAGQTARAGDGCDGRGKVGRGGEYAVEAAVRL